MKEQDNFQVWLMKIDDELDHFFGKIPTELSSKLDYTINSLIEIEGFMLSEFKSIEELLSNKVIHNQIAIYIGETFRKNLNALWKIKKDDPKFAFYGLPIIVEPDTQNTLICPLTLATTAIDRNKGDFLHQILTNLLK